MLTHDPIEKLRVHSSLEYLVLDTETTGLYPYRGDRVFLVTLSLEGKEMITFYWHKDYAKPLSDLIAASRITVMHNAKFDMHMLANEGVTFASRIWDTMVMARLESNDELSYSLDACGKRIGIEKSDEAKKYMDKNGLTSKVNGEKKYHFDKIPTDVIVRYAEQDIAVTQALFLHQRTVFKEWDQHGKIPVKHVVGLESTVTPVLFEMERAGIELDQKYCIEAARYEADRATRLEAEWKELVKQPFVDSAKNLKPLFDAKGLKYGRTEKGNASFTSDVLEPLKGNRIVDIILEHRDAKKRGVTYFEGLLDLCGNDGRIHPNFRQAGAATGRLSCAEPNAQNWPSDDSGKFPVRRAFTTSPGGLLLSMDYAQMEVRVAADEAEDHVMIAKIKSGADVHQEVADNAGTPRGLAKNGRFARQYGAGYDRVAFTLGVSKAVAKRVVDAIDASQPGVTDYNAQLVAFAKTAPWGYNWLGRRYQFGVKTAAYKYPNYRIQGGCADIMKIAMVECSKLLQGKRTKLLITIHDELVFWLADDEHYLVPLLKEAMIKAFRHKKHLDLDVGIEIGSNLCDLEPYHAG